jgi:hypothetical protein
MEIIIQFSTDAALQLARAADSRVKNAIEEVLRGYGAVLVPLHPGSDDPALRRYFAINLPRSEHAEALLRRLRPLPGIEAAYLKPSGEPP